MAEEKLEHVFEARRANPPPRDMGPASISLRHAFARAEKDGRFFHLGQFAPAARGLHPSCAISISRGFWSAPRTYGSV